MADIINKSVVYFYDEDWGWTFFFTYHSQFQREDTAVIAIEVLFLMIIFLWALIGNSLVIYIILRNKKMRTNINFFILNLSISDILFTLGNPFIATTRITESWLLGEFMCHMVLYIEFICGFVSIWTLTFISINRFKCIVLGITCRMRSRTVCILIVSLWIVSAILFIPTAMYFKVKEFPFNDSTATICTLIWPKFESGFRISSLFLGGAFVLAFVIPIIILTHNYIRIYRYLKQRREALLKFKDDTDSQDSRRKSVGYQKRLSISDIKRNQRDVRVVKVLILIVGTFLLSWIPFFIIMALIVYDNTALINAFTPEPNLHVSSQYFILAMCIAFVNACVNPVVYGTLNQNFKREFKALFQNICPQFCMTEKKRDADIQCFKQSVIENGCGPRSNL